MAPETDQTWARPSWTVASGLEDATEDKDLDEILMEEDADLDDFPVDAACPSCQGQAPKTGSCSFCKMSRKVSIVRTFVSRGAQAKHSKAVMAKYKLTKDAEQQDFIKRYLNSLSLMRKSAEILRRFQESLFSEQIHSSAAIFSQVACAMHDFKIFILQTVWFDEVAPSMREAASRTAKYTSMKQQFDEARTCYLREISILRDQRGKRNLHPEVLDMDDVIFHFDPIHTLDPQSVDFVKDVIVEKLKMIMEGPGGALDMGQFQALLAKSQSNEVGRLQAELEKKQAEAREWKEMLMVSTREAGPIAPSSEGKSKMEGQYISTLEMQVADLRRDLSEMRSNVNREQVTAAEAFDRVVEIEHLMELRLDEEKAARLVVQTELASAQNRLDEEGAARLVVQTELASAQDKLRAAHERLESLQTDFVDIELQREKLLDETKRKAKTTKSRVSPGPGWADDMENILHQSGDKVLQKPRISSSHEERDNGVNCSVPLCLDIGNPEELFHSNVALQELVGELRSELMTSVTGGPVEDSLDAAEYLAGIAREFGVDVWQGGTGPIACKRQACRTVSTGLEERLGKLSQSLSHADTELADEILECQSEDVSEDKKAERLFKAHRKIGRLRTEHSRLSFHQTLADFVETTQEADETAVVATACTRCNKAKEIISKLVAMNSKLANQLGLTLDEKTELICSLEDVRGKVQIAGDKARGCTDVAVRQAVGAAVKASFSSSGNVRLHEETIARQERMEQKAGKWSAISEEKWSRVAKLISEDAVAHPATPSTAASRTASSRVARRPGGGMMPAHVRRAESPVRIGVGRRVESPVSTRTGRRAESPVSMRTGRRAESPGVSMRKCKTEPSKARRASVNGHEHFAQLHDVPDISGLYSPDISPERSLKANSTSGWKPEPEAPVSSLKHPRRGNSGLIGMGGNLPQLPQEGLCVGQAATDIEKVSAPAVGRRHSVSGTPAKVARALPTLANAFAKEQSESNSFGKTVTCPSLRMRR